MPNLIKLPNKLKIKTTSSGYSYTNLDINVKCDFKGTEPSPKGFGLCARMVLEGNHAKGTDGNIPDAKNPTGGDALGGDAVKKVDWLPIILIGVGAIIFVMKPFK